MQIRPTICFQYLPIRITEMKNGDKMKWQTGCETRKLYIAEGM